jgi:hypothetical protein
VKKMPSEKKPSPPLTLLFGKTPDDSSGKTLARALVKKNPEETPFLREWLSSSWNRPFDGNYHPVKRSTGPWSKKGA